LKFLVTRLAMNACLPPSVSVCRIAITTTNATTTTNDNIYDSDKGLGENM